MAYNGFPATYQPMYYQPQPYSQVQNIPYMQNGQMAQASAQAQHAQQQQIQQSGFVLVRNEDEARNYPVAPGNSIYFKVENRPYFYVKTMGFNQFDGPIFERYRLEKEEDAPEAQNSPVQPSATPSIDLSQYATKAALEALQSEIEAIKAKLQTPAKKTKVTEEKSDE